MLSETHALIRHFVKVGCFYPFLPIAAQVAITQIIDQNVNDIGVLVSADAFTGGISYGAGGVLPGDGLSESTAYLIEDLADFDVFADQANAATYWASGVHTKLTCDPNLAGRIYATAVIAPDTSTNYDFQGTLFAGVFDGNSHVIRNLTIDTAGAGNDFLGLFGKIEGSGAEIRNLGLENVNITGGNDSCVLGGLCGFNSYGTITN